MGFTAALPNEAAPLGVNPWRPKFPDCMKNTLGTSTINYKAKIAS